MTVDSTAITPQIGQSEAILGKLSFEYRVMTSIMLVLYAVITLGLISLTTIIQWTETSTLAMIILLCIWLMCGGLLWLAITIMRERLILWEDHLIRS